LGLAAGWRMFENCKKAIKQQIDADHVA